MDSKCKMGRKALHLMASVPCRWASPLNEGLGLICANALHDEVCDVTQC
jgi:hypothetical protein